MVRKTSQDCVRPQFQRHTHLIFLSLSTAPTIKMIKEAFLETGETLSLKCAVLNLYPGEEEPVLHWYRGNTTTSLDEIRGGVLIETDHLTLTSHLQVRTKPAEDLLGKTGRTFNCYCYVLLSL